MTMYEFCAVFSFRLTLRRCASFEEAEVSGECTHD